ncbi:MAG TPA: ABC transporter substrate-binding protein [Desulfomonilaceae bacterium]|nr:ABC transporter substrate-binding protein [Desulfomonilaceae bacterium]
MKLLRSLLVVACSAIAWTAAAAAEPVVIGAYLPMTGNVAAYGQLAWTGITTAHKMEPDVLGRPVELRLADTKSEKVDAADSVYRLIEKDKASALIGEMISGNTLAGADIAERHKIPMVSPTATSPIVTQGKHYIFRVCFIDTDQGRVAAKLALDRMKAKTAALIYDVSQDYSVALATFFKKEFTKGGGSVVAETKFRSGDRDFSPQVGSMKSANPDIIYAPIYYTECALIARQARDMGFQGPIISGDGAQAPELIELGGKSVENVYFTAHFHPDMISNERGRIFLERIGSNQNAFTAIAADAYLILVDAIRRAGSSNPVRVRDALATTKDFEGITGKITLKPDGNAVKAMVVNTVHDGKFTYVTTINPADF